jgi:(E)-4-hydroxy-3-methylbut-2-enyl-diphosphate synthase
MLPRNKTKTINVGNIKVGGNNPISVQSMTNTDTRNIDATLEQIYELTEVGCEIIRIAIPDMEAALAFGKIREKTSIPLITDIHFDHKLAIKTIEYGADCIRINPGNIGSNQKVDEILECAKLHNCSIRIGVNAGSLEKDLREKYGVCAKALVESALRYVTYFESRKFYNFKLSLKASNVPLTIETYKLIAEKTDYPLHVGVTEAGTIFSGTIKSAVGIGSILSMGIGDTIRVSLTGNPIEEVKVGFQILKALGLRKRGVEIISCPTCGRVEINLIELAEKVENALKHIHSNVHVAVMGCVVNGPGEAREADYGIAGGKGLGIIFKKGKVLKKVKEEFLLKEFLEILKEDKIY